VNSLIEPINQSINQLWVDVNKHTVRAVYPAFFKRDRVHWAESRESVNDGIALDYLAHDYLLAVT
jgi:hypothetical protein